MVVFFATRCTRGLASPKPNVNAEREEFQFAVAARHYRLAPYSWLSVAWHRCQRPVSAPSAVLLHTHRVSAAQLEIALSSLCAYVGSGPWLSVSTAFLGHSCTPAPGFSTFGRAFPSDSARLIAPKESTVRPQVTGPKLASSLDPFRSLLPFSLLTSPRQYRQLSSPVPASLSIPTSEFNPLLGRLWVWDVSFPVSSAVLPITPDCPPNDSIFQGPRDRIVSTTPQPTQQRYIPHGRVSVTVELVCHLILHSPIAARPAVGPFQGGIFPDRDIHFPTSASGIHSISPFPIQGLSTRQPSSRPHRQTNSNKADHLCSTHCRFIPIPTP